MGLNFKLFRVVNPKLYGSGRPTYGGPSGPLAQIASKIEGTNSDLAPREEAHQILSLDRRRVSTDARINPITPDKNPTPTEGDQSVVSGGSDVLKTETSKTADCGTTI
jgi:hypothetical protein